MTLLRLVDVDASMMFNPKVTPDPADAKRLEEKLQQVIQHRNQELDGRRKFRMVSASGEGKAVALPAQLLARNSTYGAAHGLPDASTR